MGPACRDGGCRDPAQKETATATVCSETPGSPGLHQGICRERTGPDVILIFGPTISRAGGPGEHCFTEQWRALALPEHSQ